MLRKGAVFKVGTKIVRTSNKENHILWLEQQKPADPCLQVINQPIFAWAQRSPDSAAITAPGVKSLTYAALDAQLTRVCRVLRGYGLGLSDSIALFLPNGPESAVAALAVASVARCAPLNPKLRERELAFYLETLRAKALIVDADMDSVARDVARKQKVCVIELDRKFERTAAGIFSLNCEMQSISIATKSKKPDAPAPHDIALLLHTSGTTSRPKMVPLTHRNLCVSAENVRQTLQLTPVDCCLNVMPLFHIHGFVGTLLSSLHAGASVVCCPDFLAPHVLDWLGDFPVSWYSAVPAIHQAILDRARAKPEKLDAVSLRFIRSASAPLAPTIMSELENIFAAPVVEAYGMTEAAHQIVVNPLPPGMRKPGSVGLITQENVSVFSADNVKLPAMQRGEVVIRGDNVMSGYLDSPEANSDAFFDGWLRTGDEGYIDEDGYLFLTGRLKEMINRGGEKIAPREIDEVLMEHPSVSQAVAFALPDQRVGEEVAAAVVLAPKASASSQELQEYVGERLADFKVPRHIVFVENIPKGPTGKLQRIGLAGVLGLTGKPAEQPSSSTGSLPKSSTEQVICDIWSELLRLDDIDLDANFFGLGGDSILATLTMTRIQKALGVDLNIAAFFTAPTVRKLAVYIDGQQPVPQSNQAGTDMDDALLDAIEQMSEEEVKVHLASVGRQPGQIKERILGQPPALGSGDDVLNGHKLIARSLKQLGITHVYGITGTPINETLGECSQAGIRVIAVHNQSAGAQMAAAQNYVSGRLVAMTVMAAGPGTSNAALGALVAKDNGWPLLLIGGGRRQDQRGKGVFQDLDSVSLFQPLTKFSGLVGSIQQVPESLQRAYTSAMSGKPGPVFLDIPEDVLFAEIAANHLSEIEPSQEYKSGSDPDSLAQAENMLRSARRPVLLIDIELRWGVDFSLLQKFIEAYQCPFVTTHMARGYIPDDHPLCCNRLVTEVSIQADLAIILGGRLDWQFRFGAEFGPDTKILQICAGPDDIDMGRAADLAILARSSEVLKQLGAKFIKTDLPRPDRSQWLETLGQIRSGADARIAAEAANNSDPIVAERLMAEIASCLPDNAVLIADGNTCYGAAQRVIPALRPLSRLTSGQNGCIGVGIPFGLGVKLAHPDQPVVVISGDAAFGLCAMEIETAVRHKVDLVIIVANNSGPSGGKAYNLYPKEYADEAVMYQRDLPYHLLAESLGGRGTSVTRPKEVVPALLDALKTGGVTCIDVKVAPFTQIKYR